MYQKFIIRCTSYRDCSLFQKSSHGILHLIYCNMTVVPYIGMADFFYSLRLRQVSEGFELIDHFKITPAGIAAALYGIYDAPGKFVR